MKTQPLNSHRHCEGSCPWQSPAINGAGGNLIQPVITKFWGLPRRAGTLLAMTLDGLIIIAFSGCINNEKTAQTKQPSQPAIPSISIHLPDTGFSIQNGVSIYQSKPFSGMLIEHYNFMHIKSTIQYFEGKQEGTEISFFPNGQKESLRFYTAGEKDSIHCGWWASGNKRFEYHFSNGKYEGDFIEWYEGGKLGKRISYKNGDELSGKGWRENGKIYMSYVMRDGRRYGLVNAQLCYSLKNERGEYVK